MTNAEVYAFVAPGVLLVVGVLYAWWQTHH